jgi:predicted nucleic acid-binding protein
VGPLGSAVDGKIVALDSSPLIYYLEDHPSYSSVVDELFDAIQRGKASAVTSVISLLEVLVLPLRRGRKELADKYRRLLLHTRGFTVVPVDERVSELAAGLRANHPWLRTPDALQVATALAQGADLVVTNDDRWKRFPDLPIIVLKDYLPS